MLVRELSSVITKKKKQKQKKSCDFLAFSRQPNRGMRERERERERESDLHEEIERQVESIELGDEAPNGGERAEIESHDDDLRVRTLGCDSRPGFLGGLQAPRRQDQPRAAPRQHPSRLRADPRRRS